MIFICKVIIVVLKIEINVLKIEYIILFIEFHHYLFCLQFGQNLHFFSQP